MIVACTATTCYYTLFRIRVVYWQHTIAAAI